MAIRATYAGRPHATATAAQRALRPLWQVAGWRLADTFTLVGCPQAVVPGTAPRAFELFRALPDRLIDTTLAVVGEAAAVEVRHWGGAMARPAPDAGPVGHRDVPFSIAVDGPVESAEPLWRHATGGSFLNFLHDPMTVETAYPAADYQWLREVKAVYDPTNVFHRNLNIPPA